jgi:hypothetical protein
MLSCSRCTRLIDASLGCSPIAGSDDGIICDFCLSSGGRICPDCGGAHFDNHRINSQRCDDCLQILSTNGQQLAWKIAYQTDRVDTTGAVDTAGLEQDWSDAEIKLALEFVNDWYRAGELDADRA